MALFIFDLQKETKQGADPGDGWIGLLANPLFGVV